MYFLSYRYVVAREMENGPISVWNVSRGRCKGEPVSIERGLLDSTDVTVVKDTTVVVLSDRGLAANQKDGSIQVWFCVEFAVKAHPLRGG